MALAQGTCTLHCWAQQQPKAPACKRLGEIQGYLPRSPDLGDSASSSSPFLSIPSVGAQFPQVEEAGFAGGQQRLRAPGRVGSRQSYKTVETPGYSQPHAQMCTNQIDKTQGKITFEAYFAVLKLQTREVTWCSFAPCFPSHTVWAPSIFPAIPQQPLGL